jgi:predicted secreted hydrolase
VPHGIGRRLVAPLLLGLALTQPVHGSDDAEAWRELMRSDRSGFALPDPDRPVDLPGDHAAHPDFALEWWYLTANLRDSAGRRYGLQWTLFRTRISPEDGTGWQSPQLYLAHAALGSAERHLSDEKWARGDVGIAGVKAQPFTAWIDDWRWTGTGPAPFPGRLLFDVAGHAVDLVLEDYGPYVLQGRDGFSLKNRDGTLASHYFSQPFVRVSGRIETAGETVPVSGQAWFDREWSSSFLGDEELGWDWFALHLEDGSKLMLFQVRSEDRQAYRHAHWITADGGGRQLDHGIELTVTDEARIEGATYPVAWRLRIPAWQIDLQSRPLRRDSLNRLGIRYWEGAIEVSGSHRGEGFLEMTGY